MQQVEKSKAWQTLYVLFRADTLTCLFRKGPCVPDNIDNGSVLLSSHSN